MDNKKVRTLDGEIMLVQEVSCQVKLNDHQWTVAFLWAVEEYLEERRFEEICQSMN